MERMCRCGKPLVIVKSLHPLLFTECIQASMMTLSVLTGPQTQGMYCFVGVIL